MELVPLLHLGLALTQRLAAVAFGALCCGSLALLLISSCSAPPQRPPPSDGPGFVPLRRTVAELSRAERALLETLRLPAHTLELRPGVRLVAGRGSALFRMGWVPFALAFGPRGLLAVAGFDGIQLMNAATGETVGGGLRTSVSALAWSRDGKHLGVASGRNAQVWTFSRGGWRRVMSGFQEAFVAAVAFSPDGARMVAGGGGGAVYVYDPARKRRLRIAGRSRVAQIGALAFGPQGRVLAEGGLGGVALRDGTSGRVLRHLGHRRVTSLAFSRDGRLLASASREGSIAVWQVADGKRLRTLQGGTGAVETVAFAGGRRLVAGDGGGARVWDARTGALIRVVRNRSGGRSLAVSPDGTRLALADRNRIRVQELRSGKERGADRGNAVRLLGSSADRRRVALLLEDDAIALWDPRAGREERLPHGRGALAFRFGARRHLAAGPDPEALGVIRVWDPRTGAAVRLLKGHTEQVNQVAFSPDGEQLLSVSGDRTLGGDETARVWSLATGTQRRTWPVQIRNRNYAGVGGAAFAADGERVAFGRYQALAVHRLRDGARERELETRSTTAGLLAFSPDGRRLACAGGWGGVEVWDLGAGTAQRWERFYDTPPLPWIKGLAFSPDSQRLVFSGDRSGLRIWDLDTSRGSRPLVLQQLGHHPVGVVCFTRDLVVFRTTVGLALAVDLSKYDPAK